MWFKEYFSPILSLIFSSFAFFFTLRNEKNKRFNLKFDILDEKLFEMKVDRTSNTKPDVYHQNQFRLIPMVVITNESSNPVTITEIKLNDDSVYGFATKTGSRYETTFQTNIKKVSPGITIHTADDTQAIAFEDVDNKVLKIPLTIGPYQSSAGLIMFNYHSSLIGTNTISIKTSRGVKEFKIVVSSQYISQLNTDYRPPQLD